jgi:hypothetical protein
LRLFDSFGAEGEVRQPHVVPVARGELRLRNAPGRAAHGSDPGTFTAHSRFAETYDAHSHDHAEASERYMTYAST